MRVCATLRMVVLARRIATSLEDIAGSQAELVRIASEDLSRRYPPDASPRPRVPLVVGALDIDEASRKWAAEQEAREKGL